jgi:hypothetical protein
MEVTTRQQRTCPLTASLARRGHVVVTHDVVGYYRAPHSVAWCDAQPWQAYLSLADRSGSSCPSPTPAAALCA